MVHTSLVFLAGIVFVVCIHSAPRLLYACWPLLPCSHRASKFAKGKYSYYHCAATWASEASWPAVADPWLDWLPEYDRPLGEPLSDGAKSIDGTWWRNFSSGTAVAFDSVLNNGTIYWASGEVSAGPVAEPRHARVGAGAVKGGCAWVTL